MKFLVLLILVSCAQQSLTLKKDQVTPFKEFAKVTRTGEGLKTVSINSITDNRERKDHIGTALTGVQYSATPVSIGAPVDTYVKEYLVESLINRGFSVKEMDGVKIDVAINQLWVEEVIEKYQPEKAKCKANFTFYLKENHTSWEGNYWTEIVSPGDLADGTEKIAPTLASCLNELAEKWLTDKGFLKNLK